MKRVVLYYSFTENTKEAAEKIADELQVDIIRIETVKGMPKGKFGQMMFGGMKASFGMCPAIKKVPKDVSSYDEIILGTPVWAGKNAPAINTLLKKYKLSDKITAVFTSSGGGDNDKCIEKLSKKLPNLKNTVALADRNNKKVAPENENRLNEFISKIK